MFERQVHHHIPAVLLLWRAAALTMQQRRTQTAVASTARRAADGKTASISASAAKRRANLSAYSVKQDITLARNHCSRLPLPSSREVNLAGSGCAGAYGYRSISHWSALCSRLFPAFRVAALPFTVACLAGVVGAQGHMRQDFPAGLHGSRLPPRAPFATYGSGFPEAEVPADMRTARKMLESRGFVHPGMQPGAAWGAVPASGSGEVSELFEYLLLFPA